MSLFCLFVGDVIVLGKSDVFKFNYPSEAAILREKRRSGLYGMVSFCKSFCKEADTGFY